MTPNLYSLVDKETLHSMIETFFMCMNLPIQVMDEHGSSLEHFGEACSFCSLVRRFFPENKSCEKIHIDASKKAVKFGETYIFSCPCELNHIVFPLISNQTFLGSILVGPFLMESPDSVLILELEKKFNIPLKNLLELYDELDSLRVIEPPMVNHISHLLYYLFCNLINDSKEALKLNQSKLFQQSQINEAIQHYKYSEANGLTYPYEKEKELMVKVKTGNLKDARAVLNDLLGYVFFSEGNSLDILKNRSIELCSLLSRAAIEGGASSNMILKQNNLFFKSTQKITDLESLCQQLMEVVEAFTESVFHNVPDKNNDIIRKSIQYISQHFRETMTLDEVANQVHLHPSYFSSMFKQATGSSFREYLNMVRVEEGKRLLINTDYSIIDIAVAVGFEDQSYFSKVFKRYTGITPKQYR